MISCQAATTERERDAVPTSLHGMVTIPSVFLHNRFRLETFRISSDEMQKLRKKSCWETLKHSLLA